jgi:spermidine synthase
MRVIARFAGPQGEIAIIEKLTTGMRVYREGGVEQSCVLPGGEAGVAYVCLMAALLAGARRALLLGCGGGALGGMLHRRGTAVTVVDSNPISFELARMFFWMPDGIECVSSDMRPFVRNERRRFEAIGIDVGGPSFSYVDVLDPTTIAHVRGCLKRGGRIAINISCETPDDPVPARIAQRLRRQGLQVWVFKEDVSRVCEVNAVILASDQAEDARRLGALAPPQWSLARLFA